MARPPTPLPEPALKAFLDEVVVPILVERFLHQHAARVAERNGNDGHARTGRRERDQVAAGSSPG